MPVPRVMSPGTYRVDGKLVDFSPEEFTLDDFTLNVTSGNTKALSADGNYEVLYERDIEDGVGDIYGRGQNQNPLQAQGFSGLRFVNATAAAQAEGKWRLAIRTPQGRRTGDLARGRLSTDDLYDGAAGSGTIKSRRDRSVFTQRHIPPITEPKLVTLDVSVTSDITVDDSEAETDASFEGYVGESLE